MWERVGQGTGETQGSLDTLRGESTHRNIPPELPTSLGFKVHKDLRKPPGQDPAPAPTLCCGRLGCISPRGWAVSASYSRLGLPAAISWKSVESESKGSRGSRALFVFPSQGGGGNTPARTKDGARSGVRPRRGVWSPCHAMGQPCASLAQMWCRGASAPQVSPCPRGPGVHQPHGSHPPSTYPWVPH